MKIIINENQVRLIRRLYDFEQLIDKSIEGLNADIKNSGVKPDNFGVYERWVMNRIKREFLTTDNPNVEYKDHDFMMIVAGHYNNKIRKGFNKVRKKR